jgi:uncharacterized protein (DUF305 family)
LRPERHPTSIHERKRMERPSLLKLATALLAVAATVACGGTSSARPPLAAPVPAMRQYTEADVHFMTGMIPHHAQALVMSALVATRSSRADVRVLAERIIVGQRDEIEFMRMWLADRARPVPAADATHMRMSHGGVEHDMLMPGMLTDAELAQLEGSTGVEFDRLFLTFMIRHHEGALEMVEELFASPGAGQEEDVFRLASDIVADQSTEIDRMEKILAELPPARGPQP